MTWELLQRRRDVTKADLAMKMEIEDWHGVADAAMDLREIDAVLGLLNRNPPPHTHVFNQYSILTDALTCQCGATPQVKETSNAS